MNNKDLYTEYFKEAKKASEITTASMIVMDYLDIIPGNYTAKMSFYSPTDNLCCYNITDNIDGSNFKLYMNSGSYGDSFILTDKDWNDLLENMKSAYDNDKEILKRIEAFEKKWGLCKDIDTPDKDDIIGKSKGEYEEIQADDCVER